MYGNFNPNLINEIYLWALSFKLHMGTLIQKFPYWTYMGYKHILYYLWELYISIGLINSTYGIFV